VHAGVTAQAAVQVETAVEPVAQRIVLGERRNGGNRSSPQKNRERAVVGIVRLVTAEPSALAQDLSEWLESRRYERQAILTTHHDVLDLAAQHDLAAAGDVLMVLGQ